MELLDAEDRVVVQVAVGFDQNRLLDCIGQGRGGVGCGGAISAITSCRPTNEPTLCA